MPLFKKRIKHVQTACHALSTYLLLQREVVNRWQHPTLNRWRLSVVCGRWVPRGLWRCCWSPSSFRRAKYPDFCTLVHKDNFFCLWCNRAWFKIIWWGESKYGSSNYGNRLKSLVRDSGFTGNTLSPLHPFVCFLRQAIQSAPFSWMEFCFSNSWAGYLHQKCKQ